MTQPGNNTPLYRLTNLSARHSGGTRDYALQGLDLQLNAGEPVAVIGPSGAGKTTLLAVLALAHKPDEGGFEVFGQSPWQLGEAARHALRARLFLAPQTPPLPPRQRVVTAVLAARLPHWGLWQSLVSLVKPADPEAAFRALSRLHLGDKLYSRVDRLSGGERQRCGLARLLMSSAEVLLVDEPLSALDPALSPARHHDADPGSARPQGPAGMQPAPGGHGAGPLPAHRCAAPRPHRVRPAARAGYAGDDRRAVSGRRYGEAFMPADFSTKLAIGACM
ncbi:phosphonate ABC transporter ATP-binding protein [Pseudoduganella sp. UC29_106]|uniref:phosphonate ABC transporter ATP-binding protein n=1 Tax=Pseudoduganella sp. UC29_106 TaxID=3374553 RepID=UPI00375796C8